MIERYTSIEVRLAVNEKCIRVIALLNALNNQPDMNLASIRTWSLPKVIVREKTPHRMGHSAKLWDTLQTPLL